MNTDLLGKNLAEEEVCRLLAACYYQPCEEFLEENVFVRMAEHLLLFAEEHTDLAKMMDDSFRKEGPESLLLDYTGLFLGPFEIQAKPYGSVYLDGEKVIMGNSTIAVTELYRQGGFELTPDFSEVPDHIAAELEFLYLLLFQGNEAQRTEDLLKLEEVNALKKEFLAQHLGRWIEPFTAAIRSGAQSDFYRHLADLTEAFVRHLIKTAEASRAA